MTPNELRKRFKRIRLVAMDCDGVLTDGSIHIAADGRETKTFNVHDGSGVKYMQRAGLILAILSGRSADAVTHRAKELDIPHVLQGYKVKLDGLEKLMRCAKVARDEIAYIGDDLPDIPVLREVGVAVAVANARPEVKRAAHWVTKTPGGSGAVRELAERLLKAQGRWGEIIARYGLKTGGNSRGGAA